MGWFSRNRSDSEGLYTGDAPVSMPGADGEAPTAYNARPGAATGPAPAWNAPASNPGGPAPETEGWMQPPPPPVPPPGAVPQNAPWNPGQAGVWGAAADPSADPRGAPQVPPPWVPGTPDVNRIIDDAMRLSKAQRTATVIRRPGARVGCFLLIGLIVLLGIGLPVFFALRDVIPKIGESLSDPPAQPTVVGTLGAPVTVPYRDATLQVTVQSVVAQPVDNWRDSSRKPEPHLVAKVSIKRTDTGTSDVSVMSWDWYFAPAEGKEGDAELISSYEPNLSSPALGAGESVTGLLTFDTGSRAGSISLANPSGRSTRVAKWSVTGTVPQVVTGVVGKPAQAQIGLPGFTVTARQLSWVSAKDPSVTRETTTPAVLRVDLVITGAAKNQYAGQVSSTDFWFVPQGGRAVQAGYPGAIEGTTPLVSISDQTPQKMLVAIDAAKRAGVLELRDASGRVVLRWAVRA